LIDHGLHRKMALADPQPARQSDVRGVERLGPQHAAELHALYAASYPENAFDPRLLATGRFFGLWEDGRLVSAAGVHVYSAAYRVAALGNIATLPARRSRGLAQRVTARLCQELLAENIALIGLNVKAGNAPALACYRRLGFTPVAEYHEWTFTAQDS
jgi:predicted GNAT family acetyltransferase